MGRNTSTPTTVTIDRYAVGEMAELEGVPPLYNAGTSKWMKSNTFVSGASLSSTTKSNIAALPSGFQQIQIQNAAEKYVDVNVHPFQMVNTSAPTVGNVTVYPCAMYSPSTLVYVINNDGAQVINTGGTIPYYGGQGAEQTVLSNGTTFFQYYRTGTTTFELRTSTDGITWTSQTLTGFPTTYNMDGNAKIHGCGSGPRRTLTGTQTTQDSVGSYGTFGFFWCGARFINFGFDVSTYYFSSSTDGISWNGNQNSSILGTATIARNLQIHLTRNGNYCLLMIGTSVYRYSTDGGVTWNACTVTAGANTLNANYRITRNATDQLKFILWNGSSAPRYSADGGANISGDRAFPISTPISIVYVGNTVLVSDASSSYKSTNNGISWTAITQFPIGTLGFGGYFLYDTYRYYFVVYGQAQVLTSTDATTWTLRSLPTSTGTTNLGGNFAFDSNTVCLQVTAYLISSTDGGVTWKTAYVNDVTPSAVYAGQNLPVSANGGGFVCYGSGFSDDYGYGAASLSKASILAGGSFFKINSATITPLRANASVYVRAE